MDVPGLIRRSAGMGDRSARHRVLRVGWRTCRVAATGMVTWPLAALRRPPGTAPWCVLGEIAVARWEGHIDWRYRSAE
jgi:hypothetical protein